MNTQDENKQLFDNSDENLELDGYGDENKQLSPSSDTPTHGTHVGSIDNWRTRHNNKKTTTVRL